MPEDEKVEKFSWLKLAKGLFFNKMFLCMVAWFYFAFEIVNDGHTELIQLVVLIIFGVITIIWMLSTSWAKFVENGKLDVSAKIGTDINVADVVKASKLGGQNG